MHSPPIARFGILSVSCMTVLGAAERSVSQWVRRHRSSGRRSLGIRRPGAQGCPQGVTTATRKPCPVDSSRGHTAAACRSRIPQPTAQTLSPYGSGRSDWPSRGGGGEADSSSLTRCRTCFTPMSLTASSERCSRSCWTSTGTPTRCSLSGRVALPGSCAGTATCSDPEGFHRTSGLVPPRKTRRRPTGSSTFNPSRRSSGS